MLILDEARLVVLEMPKTASQALRRALQRHVRELSDEQRHGGYRAFKRHLYPTLAKEWDGLVETCCVVREPLAWVRSWYRYRQREDIVGTEKSTAEIDFNDYIEAMLSDDPPPYVQKGRQALFTVWNGKKTRVDHVFDYERLDRLLAFLGGRLGTQLRLPRRNRSKGPMPGPLPAQLQARFAEAYDEDYALYHAVQRAGGHLYRGAPGDDETTAATASG
jgi:hypothetical protein